MSIPAQAVPYVHQTHESKYNPSRFNTDADASSLSSIGSGGSEDDVAGESTHNQSKQQQSRPSRPRLGPRKTSGSMIVSREEIDTAVIDDEYALDEHDVRNMSPRRNSDEIGRLTMEARRDLVEQARVLQTSLQAIVDRVETVKSEHAKLEGGNKFLQSYIGELMQTSRIATAAPNKSKGKARGGK